jgi:hypothetical protein
MKSKCHNMLKSTIYNGFKLSVHFCVFKKDFWYPNGRRELQVKPGIEKSGERLAQGKKCFEV